MPTRQNNDRGRIQIQLPKCLVLYKIDNLASDIVAAAFHTVRFGACFPADARAPMSTRQQADAAPVAWKLGTGNAARHWAGATSGRKRRFVRAIARPNAIFSAQRAGFRAFETAFAVNASSPARLAARRAVATVVALALTCVFAKQTTTTGVTAITSMMI